MEKKKNKRTDEEQKLFEERQRLYVERRLMNVMKRCVRLLKKGQKMDIPNDVWEKFGLSYDTDEECLFIADLYCKHFGNAIKREIELINQLLEVTDKYNELKSKLENQ